MSSSDHDEKRAPAADSGNGASKTQTAEPVSTASAAAESSEPETPQDETAILRQRLTEKEAEAAANYDQFLRERAELENFRKRTRREQAEALRFANEALIRDLLPVVDNLERAVEHAAGGGNGAPLAEGVSLVLKSLQDVVKRYGVTVVDAPAGSAFDPTKHEAVGRQEAGGEPNRIVQQHERGYFLHDRLLRPAKVVVSCAKSPAGSVENGGNDD